MTSRPVINPANGEPCGSQPDTSPEQLETILQDAQQAFLQWRDEEPARREALRRCGKAISNRRTASDLAKLLTREQGKPFKEALGEVYGVSHWFTAAADLPLTPPQIADRPHVSAVYQPLGVTAAITPWNYPLLLAASKIAPALLAGNVVVLKPSPFTPLSTARMVERLTEQPTSKTMAEPPLPAGVLQAAFGDGQLGRRLIDHPAVAKITFTGSTQTGIAIARQAADRLGRVTLELGGNDAGIVLADADIETIAEPLFWAAFTNAGQFCVGLKRLYAHRSLYEPLVDKLAEIAESIQVGDGSQGGVQMGPISNSPQYQRVTELVEQAAKNGGRIRTGGRALEGPGYFYPPTIVTDLDDSEPLVAEEQFGPALPVSPFTEEDEAVRRANATTFGLGGSVWTADDERGRQVAERLECGTSWVNQHGVLDPWIPFNGHKLSGIGCENGELGVREFMKLKVIHNG